MAGEVLCIGKWWWLYRCQMRSDGRLERCCVLEVVVAGEMLGGK
jgi:hypothetical protein